MTPGKGPFDRGLAAIRRLNYEALVAQHAVNDAVSRDVLLVVPLLVPTLVLWFAYWSAYACLLLALPGLWCAQRLVSGGRRRIP